MSQRTDAVAEKDPTEISVFYLVKLLFAGGLMLLLLVRSNQWPSTFYLERPSEFFLFPAQYASGVTIGNSLAHFSGRTPQPLGAREHLTVLASVLLTLVVAPSFAFHGIRSLLIREHKPNLPEPMFIASLVVVFNVAVGTLTATFVQPSGIRATKTMSGTWFAMDVIHREMREISDAIRQYKMLPASMGGGNGTLKGFQIPEQLRRSETAEYELKQDGNDLILTGTLRKIPFVQLGKDSIAFGQIEVRLLKDGTKRDWYYRGIFQ